MKEGRSFYFYLFFVFLLLLEYDQNYREVTKYVVGAFAVVFYIVGEFLFTGRLLRIRWDVGGLLLILYFLYLLITYILGGEVVFSSSVNAFVYLVVFLVYFSIGQSIDREALYSASIFLIFNFAILSVLIFLNGGHFLIWENSQVGRTSSIFHDPNYAAVIFSIGLLIILDKFYLTKKTIYIFYMLVIFFAILITYSKSGIVFLAISGLLWLYFRVRRFFYVSIIILTVIALNLGEILYLLGERFPTLRVEDGMNGRDIFLDLALDIIRQSPFSMRGSDMIVEVISLYTYRSNVSFHNTYLDLSFVYGVQYVLALITYLFYRISKGLLSLSKSEDGAVIFTLPLALMAGTLLITPMGFGYLSFVFAILLSDNRSHKL